MGLPPIPCCLISHLDVALTDPRAVSGRGAWSMHWDQAPLYGQRPAAMALSIAHSNFLQNLFMRCCGKQLMVIAFVMGGEAGHILLLAAVCRTPETCRVPFAERGSRGTTIWFVYTYTVCCSSSGSPEYARLRVEHSGPLACNCLRSWSWPGQAWPGPWFDNWS